jgi:cation:H+ antiporter
MGWLLILAELVLGFTMLAKGADWLVAGSSAIARRFGVSILVVGLTVVAFGTSAPEIVVSGLAAFEGDADLALGNVLGSNVANIGLVLGASAVVLPRVLESKLGGRELFWLFLTLGLLWFVARDVAITRFEAGLLLLSFVVYNAHVLTTARAGYSDVAPPEPEARAKRKVLAGIVVIALGAKLVVMGAQAGALRLGIPPSVVGLTIVAVGTSLPELAAGLGGAFKGESDISVGNVVGSNVFNLVAVIGIVGVIHPLVPGDLEPEKAANLTGAFEKALSEDFYVVLAFSLAAVVLPYVGKAEGGRLRGALLLLAYTAYNVWLFYSR